MADGDRAVSVVSRHRRLSTDGHGRPQWAPLVGLVLAVGWALEAGDWRPDTA
jgi:hypothetical protein